VVTEQKQKKIVHIHADVKQQKNIIPLNHKQKQSSNQPTNHPTSMRS